MIESDYSEVYTEMSASMQSKEASASQSKRKLQQKAKDIEESGAYSENFDEEESISKSITIGKDEASMKEKMKKMDTVKEESVDDSGAEQSRDVTQSMGSSQKTPARAESSIGSLPSEDISVKDSVRSVDWKYDLNNQDSARGINVKAMDSESEKIEEEKIDEESEIEESNSPGDEDEIDSSSDDMNTRDDNITDLESCPEGIGNSQSASANDVDILTKADAITDELL